jgi:hypothetical protein
MPNQIGGDMLSKESAEKALFAGRGLPGGGQLEIRMEASADHPDPDIRAVARRIRPYNLDSWYSEWTAAAQKNEELAESFERARTGKLQPMNFICARPTSIGVQWFTCRRPTAACCQPTRGSKRVLTTPGPWFRPRSNECRSRMRDSFWTRFSIPRVRKAAVVFPSSTTTLAPTASYFAAKTAVRSNTCAAACHSSMSTVQAMEQRSGRKNSMRRLIPNEWPKQ